MKVCELFTSIQGESSHAGIPCTFIRLSGCNLRCSYCDTAYAYDDGMERSEEEIMNDVARSGLNLVEVTGGEPLLQKGTLHLIERLVSEGYTVLVETNGSMSIKDIDPGATVILDIKTPGSGMHDKTDLSNLYFLKPSDEVKFVITDRADYEWARDFMKKYFLQEKCSTLLSPVSGRLHPETLSTWMLKDRLGARLNLQIHKYIFGQEKRGV